MARCSKCEDKAVYLAPRLCSSHFTSYFEGKVKQIISKYRLIKKTDKVAVGVSGGKDSLSLLHVLRKLGYNVHAILIDEGIKGYRDISASHAKRYCERMDIPIQVISFEDEKGQPLDLILKRTNLRACSVCGVFRRYLLNRAARQFDVIATGHNLDDEAQAVIMNLLKNGLPLMSRMGPVSGVRKSRSFTKRVKPLYFCQQKEVMAYAFLNNLVDNFNECPYAKHAFRLSVRDMLNRLELGSPGIKHNIISWFLTEYSVVNEGAHQSCSVCGEASSGKICSNCTLQEKVMLDVR